MSLDLIKKLREQTGAGMMDAKRAVEEAGGDETKAIEILRKRGQKIASKKQAERETKEGLVECYSHGRRVGSMVLLACETDFVAKNEEFKVLAHEIAMQVAATQPEYITVEEVPEEVKAKEIEIYKEQLKNEGKPAEMLEKIAEGKLNKFYEQACLMSQPYIKDDKKTVADIITEATAKMGEKIEVRRIAVFSI